MIEYFSKSSSIGACNTSDIGSPSRQHYRRQFLNRSLHVFKNGLTRIETIQNLGQGRTIGHVIERFRNGLDDIPCIVGGLAHLVQACHSEGSAVRLTEPPVLALLDS